MEEFQDQIGYNFKSTDLLREALHPAGTAPPQGNKLLALVDDSVLSASLLDQWYRNGDITGTFDNASGACVQLANLS
jgi:hypothetical protein